MNNKKIAIIGYGELGMAIHRSLKNKKDLIVDVWDKKSQKEKLEGVVLSAKVIFMCVPSWCLREALMAIEEYLSEEALVICLSKGIEANTSKTVDVVLEEVFGLKRAYAVLSGPMLAEELMDGKNGFGVLASRSKKAFPVVSDIFSETNLKIEYSNDLRGVALCGVLKNIYALGLGICDGLNLGSNTKGKLTIEAISEMVEIIDLLGGKKESALNTAGAADLITTAFSNFSRNREVGEILAKTGVCCLESEGYKSTSALINILGKKSSKFPFLTAIKLIILDNADPAGSFSDLLDQ